MRSKLDTWLPWLAPALLVALFVALLLRDVTAARTHGAAVAGVLPYSDAGDYLQGANRLLRDGALDPWNSRRPLNAAFLAARLVLSGESLLGALGLQALVLGLSTWLSARALGRRHGPIAAVLLSVALLGFGGVYVGSTMSEALGLSLGALALAQLIDVSLAPTPARVFMAFLTLSVGLAARAGPLFTVPMLLVWCAWVLRDKKYFASAIAALGAGAAYNALLLWALHGVRAGTQSNFSYTLYGLSVGGLGWERAWVDHPEITAMPESQGAALIQRIAVANIKAHPLTLARGLFNGFEAMVFNWTEMFSGDLLAHHPWLQWTAFALGLAGFWAAVAWLYRARGRHPSVSMLAAVVVGMLLSVPVIYVDGRERVFAAAFPAGIALLTALLSEAARRRSPPLAAHAPSGLAAALAAGILALAVVLPRVGHALSPEGPDAHAAVAACDAPARSVALDIPRRGPRVTLTDGPSAALAGRLSVRDFRGAIAHDPNLGDNLLARSLATLPAGTTLAIVYERPTLAMQYLAIDAAAFEALGPRPTLCAVALSPDARHVLRASAPRNPP